jgi:hypothetical protein
MKRALLIVAAVALLAAAPGATSPRPSGLSPNITHPYWPMKPGTRWVYREGATKKNVVTVLSRTEKILGFATRTVHDVVYENGKLKEDTEDWYAQDRKGNIWYMGEATKEYSGGSVNTEGSWRAGVSGAQPGIIVPAHPKIGANYRQEYLKGHAEDNARNMSVDEQVTVPKGHYEHVFMTRETTPLEPKLLEYKFYARGVGPVLAIDVSPSLSFEKLISFKRGA